MISGCFELRRTAPTDTTAHMLQNVVDAIIPPMDGKPPPQHSAIDDPTMIAKTANRQDIGLSQSDLIKRFKAAVHNLGIEGKLPSASHCDRRQFKKRY